MQKKMITDKTKYFFKGIAFSLIIALFVVLYTVDRKSNDADWNWHYVLGKEILNGNANFYGADTHSWIAQERNLREMQHSWLGSVCIYLCTIPFPSPEYGALLFIFITMFISILLLHMTFYKELNADSAFGKESECRFCIYILSLLPTTCFFYSYYLTARPRNIGCILFIAALYLLQNNKFSYSMKLILFTVISTLWANFHGGSILMYFMFLAVFAVLNAIKDFHIGLLEHKQNLKDAKCCFFSLLTSMLSGMVNPYTGDLYMYALFENQSFTKQNVQEWQPAEFLSATIIFALICFFALFVLLKQKIDLKVLLPVVMTLGMTGLHCRMDIYLFIALIPVMIKILKEKNLKMKPEQKQKKILPVIMCGVIFCCMVTDIVQETKNQEVKTYKRYGLSDELIDYLHKKQYKRMYNDYNSGAYLIYNGFQSFIDARADFYTEDILVPATDFYCLRFSNIGDADRFLETFDFDAIMMNQERGSTIDYLLSKGWKIDYKDTFSKDELCYVVMVKKQA